MRGNILPKNISRGDHKSMCEKPSKMTAIRYLLCLSIICFTFPGCSGGESEEGNVSQNTANVDDSERNYTTQKIVIQKIDDEVRAVGILTDADNTSSEAIADYDDIFIEKVAAQHMGVPEAKKVQPKEKL